MKTLISLVVVAHATAAFAVAQDLRTATLVGSVTDASGGAYVVNADVAVTNIETGVVTRTKTNQEGAYYAAFLIVGRYTLEVEAPGFKKFRQAGLQLNAGEMPRVDVRLEIGSVNEQITVTAQAPLLSTDNAVVGGLTTGKEIHDTPIPQSKPQHFMYYQMGAQANNDGTYHNSRPAGAAALVFDRWHHRQTGIGQDARRHEHAYYAPGGFVAGGPGAHDRHPCRDRACCGRIV